MPAGNYIFSVDSSGAMLIRGTAPGQSGMLVAVQADEAISKPLLGARFDKTTNATILSRITLPSGSAYLVLPTLRSARLLPRTGSGVLSSRH